MSTSEVRTSKGVAQEGSAEKAEQAQQNPLEEAIAGHPYAEQHSMLSPQTGTLKPKPGVEAVAKRGVAGGGSALPHLDKIQASFGAHDVSQARAHVGGEAAQAGQALGAKAFAIGNHVAFNAAPDLHTAAHEAAHVVQQRQGVSPKLETGQAGDEFEREADAIADKVVAGESAEELLTQTKGKSPAGTVQQKPLTPQRTEGAEPTGTEEERRSLSALLNTVRTEAESNPTLPPDLKSQLREWIDGVKMTMAMPDASVELAMGWLIDFLVRDVPARFPKEARGAQAYLFDLLYQNVKGAFSGKAHNQMVQHKKNEASQSWGTMPSLEAKSTISTFEMLKLRLEGLKAFYNNMQGEQGGLLPSAPEGAQQLDPRRLSIVGIALGELGKTAYGSKNGKSADWNDVGPDGKKARGGWRHVSKYFRGVGIGESQITEKSLASETHGKSWCAIFAMWCAKEAGFGAISWNLTDSGQCSKFARFTAPQIGDIVGGRGAAENHHGIIVGINGTKIYTVEGNFSGGRVVRGVSDLADWGTHYNVEMLL
ncbi:MAG: hypothetical protein CO108_13220 [Deltaproteobacteria bacterium CG_4_9_14_3_um_filter_63_12]|nr:MAG: hypothetical protein CO108_13220 [Deltaproteobacteria bacterium CG_4_9_14_3_um_filter_63_12]